MEVHSNPDVRLFDYDDWFLGEVDKGLAAAERGEFIDHEDIGKMLDRRYA